MGVAEDRAKWRDIGEAYVQQWTCSRLMMIPLTLYPRRDSRDITDIPPRRQNYLSLRNTADVTGGKLIGV
jgi:hypothetical protein